MCRRDDPPTPDMSLIIATTAGTIKLVLRPDAAPKTCAYITALVSKHKLYDGATFCASAGAALLAVLARSPRGLM